MPVCATACRSACLVPEVHFTRADNPGFTILKRSSRLSNFFRASICEGGLGSRNSVRLSVTHVDCDKTKWRTADILISHKGQSFCYSDTNSGWWATPHSLWNLCSKWPTPSKNANFDRFPLITSEPQEIAKKFNYDEYKVDHGLSNEPSMQCVRYP